MSIHFGVGAEVPAAKVRDYLLNPEHREGRAKARFFGRMGFDRARWQELRVALLAHVVAGSVEVIHGEEFGQKYVVRGTIEGPNGSVARVLSIWIRREGLGQPQFVTAYPEAP